MSNRPARLIGVLAALTACASPSPDAAPSPDAHVVPVYEEPAHRLVFESPLVRVMDVRLPPGGTTGYHVHADRMVGVAVAEARVFYQAPGEPPGPVASPPAVPRFFDNWSQTLPYTHRVGSVDTVSLHYVVAEWLAHPGSDARALPDGAGRRLLKEGPTARVYEVTVSPGAATEPHTHAGPGLVVLGTAGALAEEEGARSRGGTGPGSWSWREGPGRHVMRNDGQAPLIVYEIDWR